ncbi:response regulator [Candidatus Margulisiibacteriota bacterium]
MNSILLIDDSFLQRKIIKNILIKQREVEITEAVNGKEGLEKHQGVEFDLIILDLLMPVLSGVDTLKELRKQKINTPVIICSADLNDDVKEECKDLNVFGYINKPPKADDLLTMVDQAVE